MKTLFVWLLVIFVFWGMASAQEQPSFGWFDRYRASIEGRKFLGENPYHRVFNWDATMSQDIRLIRWNREDLWAGASFQPVIAVSYDRKIRVSGQMYLIWFQWNHRIPQRWRASLFLTHLSSHVTQDITDPFYRDIPPLPAGLLEDANVIGVRCAYYGKWNWYGDALPFVAETAYQPYDVVLPNVWDGERYRRPFYLRAKGALWQISDIDISCIAEAEIGHKSSPITKVELSLGLRKPTQETPRIQFFLMHIGSATEIATSPTFGFFPANYSAGMRFIFEH